MEGRSRNRGSIMVVALLGILFMTLIFIHFQKVLIYQIKKADAMSLAEKSALIYYYTNMQKRKLNFLKENYSAILRDGGINFGIKDNFMGIKSTVKLKLPYLNKPVVEEYRITAPGRIQW